MFASYRSDIVILCLSAICEHILLCNIRKELKREMLEGILGILVCAVNWNYRCGMLLSNMFSCTLDKYLSNALSAICILDRIKDKFKLIHVIVTRATSDTKDVWDCV